MLHGIVSAIVTPFRSDERIDYKAWQDLIEIQIAAGVHGLLVAGGQGEFFALDEEEREVAARFCAQTVDGRVPVYVNAGAITTRETVRLAQKAESDGADAIVVVTPYYLRPSEDELVDHYVEIARSVRLPVLGYGIPERTGVDFDPGLAERIAALADNFVGLKDSSGNVERIGAYTALGLKVFMGRDHLILDGLKRGCVGAVSACANVAPRAFVALYEAWRSGDVESARGLQALVDPLRAAFSLGTFPAVVKEALDLMGLSAGRCRRPAGPLPVEARYKLLEVLETLRAGGWLAAPARMAAR
ncbi:MAG TPA: dihydrodipicolinate synthase family protein [Bryobacteraceae bacterium]|nr:dihydrodipicolinate synthase family protein [Bryobacteraceae bacterium]